jgi:predicted MFS family arabinose efflux permease
MVTTSRLAATLYLYSLFDDLILLYPVYTLLFSDNGLSVWQISSLFVIWSISSIVLEVPSGVWADRFSRRALLVAGPLLSAVGFGLWVAAPSYWAFALGFVLWGAKEALASGAFEALVYEELDRLGAADRYARTIGRAEAAGLVSVVLAMALASPVLDAGGYHAVGAASVLACLATAAIAAQLPEHRGQAAAPVGGARGHSMTAVVGEAAASVTHPPAPETRVLDTAPPEAGYLAVLRAGFAEARHSRAVRGAVLLVPAVTVVWGALEEYTPLLARDAGVADATVPLFMLLIWAGATAGGLLGGVGERLSEKGLAGLLATAAALLAVGAASGHPAGFVLLAIAFCGFQLASVTVDARLQHRITGSSRATVTSFAGVLSDLATIAVYVGYGVMAGATGHGWAFAWFALPYLAVAAGWVLSRRPRGLA